MAKRYDWPGLSCVLNCLSTMLDDRPYMRPEEPRFRAPSMQQPWSGWAILLTINVVVFLLQILIDPSSLDTRFEKSIVGRWLAFDSRNISPLLPMQLFTYQFLHGGVWHLLVNGLGLFFIGRALEQAISRACQSRFRTAVTVLGRCVSKTTDWVQQSADSRTQRVWTRSWAVSGQIRCQWDAAEPRDLRAESRNRKTV